MNSTPISLTSMFEAIGLSYGLSLPLIVLILFSFLALPAVFRPSARAESIGFAAYCYLAQMFGVLLMTAGALPALYAVFANQPLPEATYIALLLVFGMGGLIFLWNDAQLRHVDAVSKAIPGTLFYITWKFIGLLVTVFAILSLGMRVMAAPVEGDVFWWVPHLIMLLYGLVIGWFTLRRPADSVPAAAPAHKKVVVAKTRSKTKA